MKGRFRTDLAQALGVTPGVVVRLFGMRRAGNHAIADWLLRNAPDEGSVFLNNCSPKTAPWSGFRSLAVNGRRRKANKAAHALSTLKTHVSDGALVVISYEDHAPFALAEERDVVEILVYRSIRNWVASLLVKIRANPEISTSRRASTILRAFDTYADVLRCVEGNDDGLIAISYDSWVSDPQYRMSRMGRLGLNQRDNGLGGVQPYGGGSSFQKDATDAAELKPNVRWTELASDPEYLDLMRIAARDSALMQAVAGFFPEDASWMTSFVE